MAAIFALSSQSRLPDLPSRVSDKHAHAVTYAGLAVLACRAVAGGAFSGLTARGAVAAWALATAYGATDEVHQAYVPGRTADVGDWLADAAGAAAAAAGCYAWGILSRSRRQRLSPS
jgi:VanZ family protein